MTRKACATIWATGWLLAAFAMGVDADEKKVKPEEPVKKVKPAEPIARQADHAAAGRRYPNLGTIYTRHGLPESSGDQLVKKFAKGDVRKLLSHANFANFKGDELNLFTNVKTDSFKIYGATVYSHVFENIGLDEHDPFATGMANLENHFVAGNDSPEFDRARFLYVYQVVNDRGLDARL